VRALWLVRPNLDEFPGGDTTQILSTKRSLEAWGVEIDMRPVHRIPDARDAQRYDLVHLFHLDRLWENLPAAEAALRTGLPVLLSTIYWPTEEFDREGRAGLNGWFAKRLGHARFQSVRLMERWAISRIGDRQPLRWHPLAARYEAGIRRLLELASVCLPNSEAEAHAIRQRFGLDAVMRIVPNAIESCAFALDPGQNNQPRAGILAAGRLEPRKNQLALVRAVSDIYGEALPLRIVGSPGRFSRRYAARCRAEAGPSVEFIAHQRPPALAGPYRSAAVHACVSWYETPGLASLEAGACGCRLVVTEGGCTREYLGEDACYADAGDPASIRRSLECALEQASRLGPAEALASKIASRYTWANAASATLDAYDLALAEHRP